MPFNFLSSSRNIYMKRLKYFCFLSTYLILLCCPHLLQFSAVHFRAMFPFFFLEKGRTEVREAGTLYFRLCEEVLNVAIWVETASVSFNEFIPFISEELYEHSRALVVSSTTSQLMVLEVSLPRRSLLFSANSKSLHDTNRYWTPTLSLLKEGEHACHLSLVSATQGVQMR